MNNSLFGKTMENTRNRVDIKLCSNEEKAEKLIAKPNIRERNRFHRKLSCYPHENNQSSV